MIAVTACSSNELAVNPPVSISIAAGNQVTDSIGGTMTDSAAVLVNGSIGGGPLQNVSVQWVAAGGTVDSAFTSTNAAGIAYVHWTIHFDSTAHPGMTSTLTATVSNLPSVTFTATATPGNPAAIVIAASSNNQTGGLRTTLAHPLIVQVVDRHAFPVPNTTVTWNPTFIGDSLRATATSAPMGMLQTLTDQTGTTQAYLALGGILGARPVSVTANAAAVGGGMMTIGPVQFNVNGT